MQKHDSGISPELTASRSGRSSAVRCIRQASQQCQTLLLTKLGLQSGHQSPVDFTHLPSGHGLNTGEALKGRSIQPSLFYRAHQLQRCHYHELDQTVSNSHISCLSVRVKSIFSLNWVGVQVRQGEEEKKREGTDPIQNDCIYQNGFLRTVSGHLNTNTKLYIRHSSAVSKNKTKQKIPKGKIRYYICQCSYHGTNLELSPTTRAMFCDDNDTSV